MNGITVDVQNGLVFTTLFLHKTKTVIKVVLQCKNCFSGKRVVKLSTVKEGGCP